MLITESYRELNRKLHENPEFGIRGELYAADVQRLMATYGTRDVLDYGCGKCRLAGALSLPIAEYDPAVEGKDAPPEPHDIVACIDVLEHIEPECIGAVLDDLRRVTKIAAFVTIDERAAMKTLPDGRNAHLIVRRQDWWLPQLWQAGFHVAQMSDSTNRIKATLV